MSNTPYLVAVESDGADVADAAFECSWKHGGLDAAWVHVSGELDGATAPELERTLDAAQATAKLVVLDLRALTFMGAAGAHTIVGASVRARQAGRRLIALRGPPNVDRVFTWTGLWHHIEAVDLAPSQPAVQALLHLPDTGLAS